MEDDSITIFDSFLKMGFDSIDSLTDDYNRELLFERISLQIDPI